LHAAGHSQTTILFSGQRRTNSLPGECLEGDDLAMLAKVWPNADQVDRRPSNPKAVA
jgi:hypothetical protein